MAEVYFPLSGPGPQRGYLICYPVSSNQAGNYTTYYIGIAFVPTGGTSWTGAAQYWSVTTTLGHYWDGSFTIPSPGTANINLLGTYFNVAHDANGYAPAFNVQGNFDTNHSTIGDGSGVINGFQAGRIPKPASAPIPLGWDQVDTDSARYRFNAGADSGGGSHLRWEVEYWKTGASRTIVSSSGTSTITGLDPGSEYNARSRQVTQGLDGSTIYGAWSGASTMTTLAGVYVSDGTKWVAQPLRVSDGSAWLSQIPSISDGDSWEEPLDV